MYEFRRKFGCSGQVAAIDESQHPDCNIRKRVKCEPIFTQRFLYQWRRRRMRAQEREASALRGAIVIRRKPTACALAQLFSSKDSLLYPVPNSFNPRPIILKTGLLFNINTMKRKTKDARDFGRVSLKCSTWLFTSFLECFTPSACAII